MKGIWSKTDYIVDWILDAIIYSMAMAGAITYFNKSNYVIGYICVIGSFYLITKRIKGVNHEG